VNADESSIRVTLVPHTHWDREWYEPFSVFSERLVDMMDTLLDLEARGFPHFHLDGQTAMIDDYLERRPERADELAQRVAAGGLSAGPWVAQMDEFLTSGESHIRNLEMGLARSRFLGRALEVGYMPDQFGHVGQMPQILRNAGLERAMVWRGVPEQIDRSSFRWRAPDGSEVLTEYMVFGYFNGEAFDRAIEPADLAGALERSVARMRPCMAGDRMVVMVGYDHAGPDATLPERLGAAAELTHGIEARVGSIAEHLDDLTLDDDVPVWTGELRSSARAHLLPNVYSARVHQKRERGRLEALLERYVEPLAALAPSFGWPADELHRAWTLMLWNGAHDSDCGCSHDQVARDVDARFAEERTIGEDIVERALTSLGARTREGGVIRFNPSPFERDGVPALGYAVVPAVREPQLEDVAVEATPEGVSIDGIPVRFLDEPDIGDLYTFCYRERGQVTAPPDRVEVRGHEIEATWAGIRILARVVRIEDEPFVRLDGVIHNERPDHRLRMHVGLPTPAHRSLAGSPFELVDRPLVGEGGANETPSSTWPARHLAVASGVAAFHEGVFEYEVFGGHELAVTLLRCVGAISKPDLATRPFDAGPHTPTPEAQMIRETAFSIAIWSAAPTDDPAALLREWERFALPIAEAPASGGGELPSAASLLDVDLGDAQLSNVRRHEGHVEVRVWNPRPDRPTQLVVGGRRIDIGPARIEIIALS
jgi:alpha-mannosidase